MQDLLFYQVSHLEIKVALKVLLKSTFKKLPKAGPQIHDSMISFRNIGSVSNSFGFGSAATIPILKKKLPKVLLKSDLDKKAGPTWKKSWPSFRKALP